MFCRETQVTHKDHIAFLNSGLHYGKKNEIKLILNYDITKDKWEWDEQN